MAIRVGHDRCCGELRGAEGGGFVAALTRAVWSDSTLIAAVCRGAPAGALGPRSRRGSARSGWVGVLESAVDKRTAPSIRRGKETATKGSGGGQRSPQELFEVALLFS